MYCTVSSNFITNLHLAPPLGVPYHHHHQKVFGHLTCTSNMSTLRLGVLDSLLGPCFHIFNFFFGHAVFLNFSKRDPHCLLHGEHCSPLFSFMLGFTSSYMWWYPTFTVLFCCLDNLLIKDRNAERSTLKLGKIIDKYIAIR